MGPITGADLARAVARLNNNRTPSRDGEGDIVIDPSRIPPPGADPLISLFNPDGVTTFGVGTNPRFNHAQPRYSNDLLDIIDLSRLDQPYGTSPVMWP